MKKLILEQKKQAVIKEKISWDGQVKSINLATRQAYGVSGVDELKQIVSEEESKRIGPLDEELLETKRRRIN